MKKFSIILFFLLFVSTIAYSQNENVKIGIVGDKFSNFNLKTFQGNQVSMSDLKGKNILLISSRGKYNDLYWCGICSYQYAEFADLDLTQNIRKKYNMEILFLLPYNKDTVESWKANYPKGLAYINKLRNTTDLEKLSTDQKNWISYVKEHFPKSFNYADKDLPLQLPILLDEKQEVSKGLDLMRMEWGGTKVLQNVPAVYIIDENGVLRFKYISQATEDRPSAKYILDYIESILAK